MKPGLGQTVSMNGATRLADVDPSAGAERAAVFFGGLRRLTGLALIGAVVAEFVAGTGGTGSGLAYQILQAGYQLNIPRMFAALVLIGGDRAALFVLMGALSGWALGGWHGALPTAEDAASCAH